MNKHDTKLLIVAFFIVLLLSFLCLYFLDYVNILRFETWWPFHLEQKTSIVRDSNQPTEIEKLTFQKQKDKLLEDEEQLLKREAELNLRELELKQKEENIYDIKKGIQEERKRLAILTRDWNNRKKKINDLAIKVKAMPPVKVVEMMRNWKHFDIIDVIREIDRLSTLDGTASITPYLLTLFPPKERANITRKMMLPPLSNDDFYGADDDAITQE